MVCGLKVRANDIKEVEQERKREGRMLQKIFGFWMKTLEMEILGWIGS
jgi:hypothetical protein